MGWSEQAIVKALVGRPTNPTSVKPNEKPRGSAKNSNGESEGGSTSSAKDPDASGAAERAASQPDPPKEEQKKEDLLHVTPIGWDREMDTAPPTPNFISYKAALVGEVDTKERGRSISDSQTVKTVPESERQPKQMTAAQEAEWNSRRACLDFWVKDACVWGDDDCRFSHEWKHGLRKSKNFQDLEKSGRVPAHTRKKLDEVLAMEKIQNDSGAMHHRPLVIRPSNSATALSGPPFGPGQQTQGGEILSNGS